MFFRGDAVLWHPRAPLCCKQVGGRWSRGEGEKGRLGVCGGGWVVVGAFIYRTQCVLLLSVLWWIELCRDG